jgi:hypothetical protein
MVDQNEQKIKRNRYPNRGRSVRIQIVWTLPPHLVKQRLSGEDEDLSQEQDLDFEHIEAEVQGDAGAKQTPKSEKSPGDSSAIEGDDTCP